MALPPALVNSLSQGKIGLSVPLKSEPWLAQLDCTEDLLFIPWPWGFVGGKPSSTAHPGSIQQQLQGLPILGFHQPEEAGLVLCRAVADVATLPVEQHCPAVVALKRSHYDGRRLLGHIH